MIIIYEAQIIEDHLVVETSPAIPDSVKLIIDTRTNIKISGGHDK